MNYYWWRSNGESGASGHIYAKHISDAENKINRAFKEPSIQLTLLKENVKKNEITGEKFR